MVKDHGWCTSDIELEFFCACKCHRFVHTSVLDLTQLSSTELEASVSGYTGAIFRSCHSITEAQIRFRLFIAKVTKWFAGPDPFPGVGNLMMEIEIESSDEDYDNRSDDEGDEEMEPEPQPVTPEPLIPRLPLASQAGGLPNMASINDPAMSNNVEGPPRSASNSGMMPAGSALDNAADPLKPGPSNETA